MMDEAVPPLGALDEQAQIFKVLTHPVRIAILEVLRDGEHCVCHIEACLGLRQAYISQQLAVLRDGGLVRDRRDGWNIFYHVVDPRIFEALDIILGMTGQAPPDFHRAGFYCTCPHCVAERSPGSSNSPVD